MTLKEVSIGQTVTVKNCLVKEQQNEELWIWELLKE